jgi:hypothetical protein
MLSPGMWRLVGLGRTDVSEERVVFIFRMGRISELETLAINSVLRPVSYC